VIIHFSAFTNSSNLPDNLLHENPGRAQETGIITFMTGPNGVIYERDLGPDTVKLAASIQEYNPTDDWSEIE
jgi:hypothetical protein